jgi:hypothetical protein
MLRRALRLTGLTKKAGHETVRRDTNAASLMSFLEIFKSNIVACLPDPRAGLEDGRPAQRGTTLLVEQQLGSQKKHFLVPTDGNAKGSADHHGERTAPEDRRHNHHPSVAVLRQVLMPVVFENQLRCLCFTTNQ